MSGALPEAAAFVATLYPVFPCGDDKKPCTPNGFHDAVRGEDAARALFRSKAGAALIGVPTGPGSGLCVVDIDTRDGGAGFVWLAENENRLPRTRRHRTRSGGLHLVFRHPTGCAVPCSQGRVTPAGELRGIAPGVDVRGRGGYAVFPPSEGYAVEDDAMPAEMPAWLVEACHPPARPAAPPPPQPPQPPVAGQDKNTPEGIARLALDRECEEILRAGNGAQERTLNAAAFNIGQLVEGGCLDGAEAFTALYAAALAMHSHDPARPWKHDDLERKVRRGMEDGRRRPRVPEPRHQPRQHRVASNDAGRRAAPEAAAMPDGAFAGAGTTSAGNVDWLSRCQQGSRGAPVPNLANAVLALREAPALAGLLIYDELARTPMVTRPVPGSRERDREPFPRPIRDTDVNALTCWLQGEGFPRMARDTVFQAVASRAAERAFHPIRTYLAVLRWDVTQRLDTWLNRYAGVEDTPYTRGIGVMFMVALVARAQDPGSKADYMLVLEGEQGAGKSTLCRILGGEWFSDNLPPVSADPVRLSQHLRGKWLVEIAEMHAMSRAENAELKAFISRPSETFTPKYGRMEVTEPRQCLFIGTTNKDTYLRDETGGRRFWPVKVGGLIDTDGLRAARDQLFAEAAHLYRQGVQWWPERDFEVRHIRPEQDARFEVHPWTGPIAKHVARMDRVTVAEIMERALFIKVESQTQKVQNDVVAVLTHLGWVRSPSRKAGRVYVRKGTP